MEQALGLVSAAIWTCDAGGRVRAHNGREPDGIVARAGATLPEFLPDAFDAGPRISRAAAGEASEACVTYAGNDGALHGARIAVAPHRDGEVVVVIEDRTREAVLERELRRAGAYEATARLAIAAGHEFNNMLTVIRGHTDLLLRRLDDERMRAWAEDAKCAAERAADLTRRILATAHRHVAKRTLVDLNSILGVSAGIAQHVLGDRRRLAVRPHPGPAAVRADASRLERALLHLCIELRGCVASPGRVDASIDVDDGAAVLRLRGAPTRRAQNDGAVAVALAGELFGEDDGAMRGRPEEGAVAYEVRFPAVVA